MSLLNIARIGHPVLRRRAAEVPAGAVGSAEVRRLIDDMVETMRDADGVGLAGPQVYAGLRVLTAEVPAGSGRVPRPAAVPLLVLVNPVLLDHSADRVDDWEGCLSIPDLRGLVPRWRAVRVAGLDRQGAAVTVEADGFLARILQHEMDHLDGVLFPERMADLRTLATVREYQRHWAGTAAPPPPSLQTSPPSSPPAPPAG